MLSVIVAALVIGMTGDVGRAEARTISYAAVQSNQYQEGWKAGWDEGWKYVKGEYSFPPFAPFPPFPKLGQDTYTGGYNAGFLAGIAAARKR